MDDHNTTPPELRDIESQLQGLAKANPPAGLTDRITAATAETFFGACLEADLERLETLFRQRPASDHAPTDLTRRIYYDTVEHLQQAQLDSELRPLDAQLRQSLRTAAPHHLSDRIFATTCNQLTESTPSVVGRIGFERVMWYTAVAAAWAIAIGAAVWMSTLQPSGTDVVIRETSPVKIAKIDDLIKRIDDGTDVTQGEVAIGSVDDTDLELMAMAIEIDDLEMQSVSRLENPIDRQINQLLEDLDSEL